MNNIRYLPIPDFPGYRVGDDGSVWTCRTRDYTPGSFGVGVRYRLTEEWTKLSLNVLESGYLDVQLYRDGKAHHCLVHRLVLLAFVGKPPPSHETLHDNNNRSDNRLTNLRWGTKKENQQQRKKFKTDSGGENHGAALLSNQQAKAMRDRYRQLKNKAAVAREFGVSRSVASKVILGRTYRD